jgi:hypothetical protein
VIGGDEDIGRAGEPERFDRRQGQRDLAVVVAERGARVR